LREGIDRVDVELLALLNERMRLCREVGRIKGEKGLELFDPGREESIYKRLSGLNSGPLPEGALRSVYREILAASRLLQYPLSVAVPGSLWSGPHLAAFSLFGRSARYSAHPAMEGAFDALAKGKARVTVVPIENSLDGAVGRAIDLLYERDVQIVGECYLEIAHYLATSADSMNAVKTLYATARAFGQCRRWVSENLAGAERRECASTAQAALLAKEDPSGAAVCNLYAAAFHELPIAFERIEDDPGNAARFLVLATRSDSPTANDGKSSVLFAVPDRPGALQAALEPFERWKINLMRLEARPNRRLPWEYLYFADIDGQGGSEEMRLALDALRERVRVLKVLGSYPKGDPKRPIRIEKEEVRTGLAKG
jgi:chorismate mutase/prephenate dehydratase